MKIRILKKRVIGLLCLLSAVFSITALAAKPAFVDGGEAEVREGPGPKYRVVGKVPQGTPVATSNLPIDGFFKVRTESGQVGWIASQSLQFDFNAAGAPPAPVIGTPPVPAELPAPPASPATSAAVGEVLPPALVAPSPVATPAEAAVPTAPVIALAPVPSVTAQPPQDLATTALPTPVSPAPAAPSPTPAPPATPNVSQTLNAPPSSFEGSSVSEGLPPAPDAALPDVASERRSVTLIPESSLPRGQSAAASKHGPTTRFARAETVIRALGGLTLNSSSDLAAVSGTSLTAGEHFGGELGFGISSAFPALGAVLRAERVTGSTTATASNGNHYVFSQTSTPVMAGLSYALSSPDTPLQFSVAAMLGVGIGTKLTATADQLAMPNVTTISETCFSELLKVNLDFRANASFSIFAEAGYRLLRTSSLPLGSGQLANNGSTLFSIPVEVDLSGPVISAGVAYFF